MNILVIGCDQVGASLVRDLERIGHDISIIEKDSEQLKRLDAFDDYTFSGNALTVSVYHIPTLCAPGIQKFYLWNPLQLFYLSAGENMLYWDVDLSETKFNIFTAR